MVELDCDPRKVLGQPVAKDLIRVEKRESSSARNEQI